MTLQESQQYLIAQLSPLYDAREASNIAHWVLEHLTGWKKIDRLVHKEDPLSAEQNTLLEQYIAELLTHKPVQYVLREAWFYGLPLYVDEHVLIPRPETEELVEWVIQETGSGNTAYSILDIGTGSGCIPIALKKQLPAATVYACDVSEGALAVAQKNAQMADTAIQFIQTDFLVSANWGSLPEADIIVSNPPYIPVKDKGSMRENVLQHEPHLALFVENDDPLLFYRSIAQFARQKLLPGGRVYVEIHEDLGAATLQLFTGSGFTNAELKKDMQGKDRMIRAMKIT
jgi:release factor glutamine methyltransferase